MSKIVIGTICAIFATGEAETITMFQITMACLSVGSLMWWMYENSCYAENA